MTKSSTFWCVNFLNPSSQAFLGFYSSQCLYVLSSKICAFICEERERYFMQISPRGHQRRFSFCIPPSRSLDFSLELCFEAAFLGIVQLPESKERKSCCIPEHSPLLCCLSQKILSACSISQMWSTVFVTEQLCISKYI